MAIAAKAHLHRRLAVRAKAVRAVFLPIGLQSFVLGFPESLLDGPDLGAEPSERPVGLIVSLPKIPGSSIGLMVLSGKAAKAWVSSWKPSLNMPGTCSAPIFGLAGSSRDGPSFMRTLPV
jgi:hypothetical protein